jgi:hypothetical protein
VKVKEDDMTDKEFFNAVGKGQTDVLALLLRLLQETGTDYCVVGGLAVNAYVEPVVSLDLDIVVAAAGAEPLCSAAVKAGMKIAPFEHSLNLTVPGSDLRIQIRTDERHQVFVPRAETRTVLGYTMRVAALRDVLQGKLWAWSDPTRRKSKRQKDLADIARLVEAEPSLREWLPEEVKQRLD